MVGDEKNGETEYTSDRKQGRCYDVYHRNSDGTWETIKNGFSWPAMLFGAFWAWSKGLVGIGFALLALGIFLRFTPVLFAMILGEAGVIFDLLISLVVITWVGLNGNEWRRRSMGKRSFELVARSVYASSRDNAISVVLANTETMAPENKEVHSL